MKTILNVVVNLSLAILILFLLYMGFSFGNMTLDYTEWGKDSRIFLGFVGTLVLLAFIFFGNSIRKECFNQDN